MSSFTDEAAVLFKEPFTQKIGALIVDIITLRNITEKMSVTSNPIEGAFTTNNARFLPVEIEINGIMSKYSLRNSLIRRALSGGRKPNTLKDAHDELYRIFVSKEPIELVTKYKSYKNMIMSQLNIATNIGDGDTLRFNTTFTEARIVSSQLVTIDNSQIKTDTAKKQTAVGRQAGATKDFSPTETGTIGLGTFLKETLGSIF